MINIEFKNLDKVISQVEKYAIDIKTKEKEILDRLAMFGATRVSIRFSRAIYSDPVNISVNAEVKDNVLTISAQGQQVCFIEFGAGVRYGYGYQGTRPPSVVGIGEYGKGKGKNPKGWWYGSSKHTYGNPPNMPMYNTMNDIAEYALDVVREVFSQ